ncbi:glycosyltransferase [Glaciecola sp. KUL10]|uniref:glycosyltransferase n=1 Tax=Glaciecola sp. (strain KUL10) TaxID=2161813 RepID=UPI000D784256|nr:glycosyltransferase [Glaciecola sp. KUL10]GBL06192.1 glycosyl transferase, group 1 [Glaciecola sp. KUL10]
MPKNPSAKKPKHVGMIIDSLSGGGAEKVVLELAASMSRKGCRVCIFVLKELVSYPLNDDFKVIFPLSGNSGSVRGWFNEPRLSQQLFNAIRAEEKRHGDFDLSLIHLYESYRLASNLPLKNAFYVMHNSYQRELKREARMGPLKYFYQRRILKRLSGKNLIAVSNGVKQELEQSTLFKPSSVKRIYNPFDIKSIQNLAQQNGTGKDLYKQDKVKFILHVGRAARAKRHDVLFRALKHVDERYKLVCLSENVKKLSKLAKQFKVEDRVILPGFSQNPYQWMNRAEVTVLSSDFEGLSMVLIESLICDTKIVSTDCDFGPREIMRNGLRHFLCELGNPEELGNKINEALPYKLTQADKDILNEINSEQISQAYLDLLGGTTH